MAENEIDRWLKAFHGDPEARFRATTELGLIGMRLRREPTYGYGNTEKAALPLLSDADALVLLDIAVAAHDEDVVLNLVFALGELCGEGVLGRLIGLAEEVPTEQQVARRKEAVARAVGKIGGHAAGAFLMERADKTTLRSVLDLVARHTDDDFSREMVAPRERGDDTAERTDARRIRQWLEDIARQNQGEYVGLLAEQALTNS